MDKYLSLRAENRGPRGYTVSRGVPVFPRIFNFRRKGANITCIKNRECVVCFSFDQSIAASDNRLSYACILLFPKSTKVSFGDPVWGSWQVLTRARTLAYVTEQGSAKTPKRRELSVFNRVDRFLAGNPKYRYKTCEKCRGDAAQKDNSDLANTVT